MVLVVAAMAMKRPPPDRPAAAVGGAGTATAPPAPPGGGFAEIRRSRVFWTLCAAQLLFFPTLMTVPLHIAVHGMDLGMTRGVAAVLLTVIGGASIAGRLTVGVFADRIGGRYAYVLCLVPLVTSLLILMVVDTYAPLFAVVALYGFGHGGLFTVVSPTVAEFFGTRAHGAIYGGIYFFGTIGGAAGPIMAGRVFDVTGSYEYAFAALALMGTAALLLMASLPPRRSEQLLRAAAERRAPPLEAVTPTLTVEPDSLRDLIRARGLSRPPEEPLGARASSPRQARGPPRPSGHAGKMAVLR